MKGKKQEIVSEVKKSILTAAEVSGEKHAINSSYKEGTSVVSVVQPDNKINLLCEDLKNADDLNNLHTQNTAIYHQEEKPSAHINTFEKENLIRLFLKKGEYIYARPNDIVMVESCDHLVKVYIIFEDKIKKTIRCNTLKDFLLQLPQNQFIRIGRFCAINLKRLSGGDCNQQTFEFDFKVSIKLKHSIPCTAFNNIGI